MKTYKLGKLQLELYDDFNKIKLFRIFADYRPLKTLKHKNYYYVYAWTKKQAKEYFQKKLSWLKVFEVNELTPEERAVEEMKSPEHNLILNCQQYEKIKDLLSRGALYEE